MDLADLLIREITLDDAIPAARLSGELGYAASPGEMSQRIAALGKLPDHVIYVACLSGSVVGWIDVCITHHLASEPRVEIGGLVVSSEVRGSGIGSRLLTRAEAWALEHGLKAVVVRSQIAREAAHRFYLREGYERTKTSAVFTRILR